MVCTIHYSFLNLNIALKLTIPFTKYKSRVSTCMTLIVSASLNFAPYVPHPNPCSAVKLANIACFAGHTIPSKLFNSAHVA